MSSDWKRLLVSDLADKSPRSTASGPFGSNLVSKDYTDTGVPVIRGGNMSNGRWVSGDFAFVSEEKAEQLSSNHAYPGELIFTQRGTLGQVCLVPHGTVEKYVISQSQMKLRVDRTICDPLFMLYQFKSPEQQIYIDMNSIRVGVPHTNLGILRDTPCQVPPLSDQKAIANILGTLDNKIELNRKTNETLEGIAKALFKSWFVDFDPVRAKAEGRPTGLPDEISVLFPDSFEESELGEIPSGWGVMSLGDLIALDSGLPYKGALKGTGNALLLTMGCADKHLRFKNDGVHRYPADIKERHLVKPGEMIICSHDLTQARDQLGQPFIVPDYYGEKVMAAATNTFIVRAKVPDSGDFLYQLFRSNGFREQMIASAKGSVILHISKDAALSYEFPSPQTFELIIAYQRTVGVLSKKIGLIASENKSLSDLRDALLPRLISGELRVLDAEKMLEEVDI